MAYRIKNQNTLVIGDWNAQCDRCGFKFKASDLKKTWDGLYVCKDDWEPRHPMDFLKGRKDDPSVPWSRPESSDSSGTDINGSDTGFIGNTVNVDDVNKALTVDTDPFIQNWNTTLTANRSVILNRTSAESGDRFKVYRSASTPGSYSLTVVGKIGSELTINGEFDSGTGWTVGSNWSITGGQAVATASIGNITSTGNISFDTTSTYVLAVDIDSATSGDIRFTIGGGNSPYYSTSGVHYYVFTPTASSTTLIMNAFGGAGAFTGAVNSVSVFKAPTLQTIPSDVTGLVEAKYDGNSWVLESYITFGL